MASARPHRRQCATTNAIAILAGLGMLVVMAAADAETALPSVDDVVVEHSATSTELMQGEKPMDARLAAAYKKERVQSAEGLLRAGYSVGAAEKLMGVAIPHSFKNKIEEQRQRERDDLLPAESARAKVTHLMAAGYSQEQAEGLVGVKLSTNTLNAKDSQQSADDADMIGVDTQQRTVPRHSEADIKRLQSAGYTKSQALDLLRRAAVAKKEKVKAKEKHAKSKMREISMQVDKFEDDESRNGSPRAFEVTDDSSSSTDEEDSDSDMSDDEDMSDNSDSETDDDMAPDAGTDAAPAVTLLQQNKVNSVWYPDKKSKVAKPAKSAKANSWGRMLSKGPNMVATAPPKVKPAAQKGGDAKKKAAVVKATEKKPAGKPAPAKAEAKKPEAKKAAAKPKASPDAKKSKATAGEEAAAAKATNKKAAGKPAPAKAGAKKEAAKKAAPKPKASLDDKVTDESAWGQAKEAAKQAIQRAAQLKKAQKLAEAKTKEKADADLSKAAAKKAEHDKKEKSLRQDTVNKVRDAEQTTLKKVLDLKGVATAAQKAATKAAAATIKKKEEQRKKQEAQQQEALKQEEEVTKIVDHIKANKKEYTRLKNKMEEERQRASLEALRFKDRVTHHVRAAANSFTEMKMRVKTLKVRKHKLQKDRQAMADLDDKVKAAKAKLATLKTTLRKQAKKNTKENDGKDSAKQKFEAKKKSIMGKMETLQTHMKEEIKRLAMKKATPNADKQTQLNKLNRDTQTNSLHITKLSENLKALQAELIAGQKKLKDMEAKKKAFKKTLGIAKKAYQAEQIAVNTEKRVVQRADKTLHITKPKTPVGTHFQDGLLKDLKQGIQGQVSQIKAHGVDHLKKSITKQMQAQASAASAG